MNRCGSNAILEGRIDSLRVSNADTNNNGNGVGGGNAGPLGSWPWMGSLEDSVDGRKYSHVCGGSVITKNHVLTAAHCLISASDR